MDDPRIPPPPTASSAEKPLQPPAPPEEPISAGKGVKETIESILIAFILAFVFRAFVVEAFVIPTGSMATTLLGAHMRYTCKECGYQFEVGYSNPPSASGDDTDIPSRAYKESFGIYCPNCRHKVSESESTEPPIRYGDRILVLKYLYIPWISSPHRWDVVVFKTPDRPRDSVTPFFTVNYIKRLIGLPNDKIMILDGDVYIWDQNNLWSPDPEIRATMKDHWKIQAKPRYAQDAMWRIIYDDDYRPLHEDRPLNDVPAGSDHRPPAAKIEHWTLPWIAQTGSGWNTGEKDHSRVISFNNPTGGGRLRFDPTSVPHYDPVHAPGGYFTDWLAYNEEMRGRHGFSDSFDQGENVSTVSDFKLTFFYQRKSGDGPLKAHLTKHHHEFVLEMLPDHLRLLHRLPNKREVEIAALKPINPSTIPGQIRVDFANVDYHVTVRINDELAFETTPEEYHPNVNELWDRFVKGSTDPFPIPTVALEAQRQQAAFSHVSLWRDVYYTSGPGVIYRANPNAPAELNGDEYFTMGDNSAASSDARMWMQDVNLPEEDLKTAAGRVPARFMLGRAFFVYWPAGYRPLNSAPALVPNFGDMRLIH
jgi:signal peptidase I